MIGRRGALALGLGAGVAACGAGAALLRFHRTPRRVPLLGDAHLKGLALPADGPPRVLFVGNSATLDGVVPARTATAMAARGVPIRPATAAANGARLIETLRLAAFRASLRQGWEALVLQDFSATAIDGLDRRATAVAVPAIRALAGSPPTVIFPHWPYRADHARFARGGAGTPRDMARASAWFDRFAAPDVAVAPVVERWMAAPDPLWAEDGHHASDRGAALVADALADALVAVL